MMRSSLKWASHERVAEDDSYHGASRVGGVVSRMGRKVAAPRTGDEGHETGARPRPMYVSLGLLLVVGISWSKSWNLKFLGKDQNKKCHILDIKAHVSIHLYYIKSKKKQHFPQFSLSSCSPIFKW